MTDLPPELAPHLAPGPDGRVDAVAVLDAFGAWATRQGGRYYWILAGEAARLAWGILHAESDAALARWAPADAPAPDAPSGPWAALLGSAFVRRLDHARRYNDALEAAGSPLAHLPRRPALPRRATLDELLAALRDAEANARQALQDAEARETRSEDVRARRARARGAIVPEDPARDLAATAANVSRLGEGTLREIAPEPGRAGYIAGFLSALELRRRGDVELLQDDVAVGSIRVRRRT